MHLLVYVHDCYDLRIARNVVKRLLLDCLTEKRVKGLHTFVFKGSSRLVVNKGRSGLSFYRDLLVAYRTLDFIASIAHNEDHRLWSEDST